MTAVLLMGAIAVAAFTAAANVPETDCTAPAATPLSPADPAPAPSGFSVRASAHPAAPPAMPGVRTARRRPPPTYAASQDWADLMARVNHELRTPLNAVLGFSEVMALEMFGPLGNERYQEYVRYIRQSAGELLKSAEDTLAITALLTDPRPAEKIVPCILDHAVADAWSFLAGKAAMRCVVLEPTLPDGVEVLGEPRALRQIFVNIFSEAVNRAAPGERIALMAAADGEVVEIAVSVKVARSASVPRAGSLPMCLARALLEVHGTSLLEIETAPDGWRAVTVLDRAAQPDFFVDCPVALPLKERGPAFAI
ncbi:MAG: HAMP domain-containing sensor histidine kinase [Hyphomicrobium sp.]